MNNNRVFIIAEAGVNHNGDMAIAKSMIDEAVKAGADAIKFQTFKAEMVATDYALKADYQLANAVVDESQLEMLKKLELTKGDFESLASYCEQKHIKFISSPFDVESVKLLGAIGQNIFKVPSGEITNLPYLRSVGKLAKSVILSTGMANIDEIQWALGVLTDCGLQKDNIIVLHCNTEYPTPYEDVNLSAMHVIKESCGVEVGYSDHTLGIEVAVAAVALGAMVIEKHFTLDSEMSGPDHKASMEPSDFREMVLAIRNVEACLGDGVKKPSKSELKNIPIVRRSIVAARSIQKGEVFSDDNITAKRPGNGMSPIHWDEVIGIESTKFYEKDELIEL
jgi:N,N'-diacetyllegionaminate synthase